MRNVLDCIGHTPLIGLENLVEPGQAQLCAKWERTNPAGSIKDRPARFIVNTAERLGLLVPGGTIIESSSGNFGISLAMIGAARGYRVVILIDPKTTPANRAVLNAFGAELIVVTEPDDTGSYHKTRIKLANELAAEIPDAFRPDQCFNLLNSQAHYEETGPELLAACEGRLDLVVAAVSTGGQLGGLSRYFHDCAPHVQVVGVDACGSAIFGGCAEPYLIPGVGLGWTPANLDLDRIDATFKIDAALAFLACRVLARREGVLAGASSGAALAVGLHYAQVLGPGRRVACLFSDGGDRYLDTVYNDEWLAGQGIRFADTSAAALRAAARRLRPYSELPALCGTHLPGIEAELRVPESTRKLNDSALAARRINKEIPACPVS